STNPSSVGGKNDFLYVVGAKGKISGGGFWAKAEFDQDFGDNRTAGSANDYTTPAAHYCGWASMGNIGFKAEDENTGMFSIWGEAAIGSGRQGGHENRNDGWVAIANDYRPGTIYGRFQAIPGVFGGLGANIPTTANGIEALNPAGAS